MTFMASMMQTVWPIGDRGADIDEIRRVRGGFQIERADHGRGDFRCPCPRARQPRPQDPRRQPPRPRGGGSGGGSGGQAGEQAAEVIDVGAFFQLEVKVLLGEIEKSETVLVHELDDSTDFLECPRWKNGWEFGWDKGSRPRRTRFASKD